MPFSLSPTYRHSRRRAAISLAKHGDITEAARVARVPIDMLQRWLADDVEFQTLLRRATRKFRHREFMLQIDRLRDWSTQAPEEVTTILMLRRNAFGWAPAELKGRPIVGIG